jgi:hypothetical protein
MRCLLKLGACNSVHNSNSIPPHRKDRNPGTLADSHSVTHYCASRAGRLLGCDKRVAIVQVTSCLLTPALRAEVP